MKSRGAMHMWGEGREEGLERLRREVTLVLMGLWTLFFVAACFQLVAMGSAWSGESTTITGVALENVGPEGSMVRLVVKTNTGLPVDADKVLFKVKKRVVRVTFSGVPLDPSLGQEVIFDAEAINRVEKGYAIPDGEEQSLVRLRFDELARTAIQGHAVESVPGGFAVVMPFGGALPASAPLGASTGDREEPGEEAGHEEAFQALADELNAEDESGEEAEAGEGADAKGTPLSGALADGGQSAAGDNGETPLELADPASGPSMTRVAGSMMVVILLILGLSMAARRMRGEGGAPWQASPKTVKVLSTHRLTRGVQLLIVDILGDVVVLGLGQGRLSMLYKVPEVEQARYRGLEQNNATKPVDVRAEVGASLGALLGRLGMGEAVSTDESQDFDEKALDASEGTLEALAASLDAKLDDAMPVMMASSGAEAERSALESVLKSADMESMRQMGEVLDAKMPPSPQPRAVRRNSLDRITPKRVLDDEVQEVARPNRAVSQYAQVAGEEEVAEAANFESFLERRLAQRNRRAEHRPAPRTGITSQGRATPRAERQSGAGAPAGPNTLPVRRKLATAEQEPLDDVTRSIRNRARALGRL